MIEGVVLTLSQVFLVVVVAIPLVLVSLDRMRADVAALTIAVLLGVAQYAGLGVLGDPRTPGAAVRAISGLAEPVTLTLLSLFVITHSLDRSGVTRWLSRYLIKVGRHSEKRLIGLFSTVAALLSLVMNNLTAGALLLPSAMEVARRTGVRPSKLLIPVAYGSLLGGAATYFATANIIVSNLLTTADPAQPALHILAFAPTGGLIVGFGLAFLVLVGRRWLPDHQPEPEQMMARYTGTELEQYYQLKERLWQARVLPDSTLVGKSLAESEIGERFGLVVAGVRHGRQAVFAPPIDEVIMPGDSLLIVGREAKVNLLREVGLELEKGNSGEYISKLGVSFIEVMPAPHSRVLGRTLRELGFRSEYLFTALALLRGGRSYRTDVGDFPLALGDSLLMIGLEGYLQRLRNNPDFIVLEPDLGDQPIHKARALLTGGVIVAIVGAAMVGVPVYLAALAGAVLLVLAGALRIEDAYRAVEWQAIFMVAGMYSVSLAMVNTGLAGLIAERMLSLVVPLGPLGLAGAAYVLTALLTQVMGGQVSVLVTGPILISAAIAMHTNPQAVAVAAATACSASFLTPVAHPVNILMVGPANYQFRDFFHIGWRLTLVCFVALIAGLVLFWGL